MTRTPLTLKEETRDWIVIMVGGTQAQIEKNQGEVVLDTAQTTARLGIGATRLFQLCKAKQITPIMKTTQGYLFLQRDVEKLRADRAR